MLQLSGFYVPFAVCHPPLYVRLTTLRDCIVLAFVLGFHTAQGLMEGYVSSVRLYCTDLPLAEALMARTADVSARSATST